MTQSLHEVLFKPVDIPGTTAEWKHTSIESTKTYMGERKVRVTYSSSFPVRLCSALDFISPYIKDLPCQQRDMLEIEQVSTAGHRPQAQWTHSWKIATEDSQPASQPARQTTSVPSSKQCSLELVCAYCFLHSLITSQPVGLQFGRPGLFLRSRLSSLLLPHLRTMLRSTGLLLTL